MDIIGIDNSVVDHILAIDALPRTDEEITIKQQSWQGGGKVATALVAASRLGASTGLLGVTGNDRLGHFIKRDMQDNGVDVSHFLQEEGKTSNYCISLAEQSTGGRSFLSQWGSHRSYAVDDIDVDYVRAAKCIHMFQFSDADLALAALARENGLPVCFDADEYREEIWRHIHWIDLFIGSEFFYRGLFGDPDAREENCRKILSMGPKVVIFTIGGAGCFGMNADGYFSLPGFKVEVLDTTGAGDVFHGAFLYAYICEQMTTKDAALFASAVAAVKCTQLGGRAGIPTRQVVGDFMRTGCLDDRELLERAQHYRNVSAQ